MSLTITNQHPPMMLQGQPQTNKHNVNAPVDFKDKAQEVLSNRENYADTGIENHVSNKNERLGVILQFAEDNGYEHLANRATQAINHAEHRAAERVEHRFDTTEQFIEQRPGGVHKVTEENAEVLISRLESNAEARIASLDERSTMISDRLAELEQQAIDKGYDGNRFSEHADRIAEHFQQKIEHVDERLEQTLERIQSRLEEAYESMPELDPGETPDDGLIDDLTA